MFADFIRCTHNGTGGAGTLTLAAISGWPQPTDAFGTSGTRRVGYVLSEWTDSSKSVPLQAERGRGLLNLATNVLTRDEVALTWVAGTGYTSAGASALSFGNTAANIDLELTATAVTQRPALPALPTSAGTVDTPYTAANTRVQLDTNAGGQALVNGTRYYQLAEYDYAKPISIIAVNATAVATTGNVRLSVYDVGADGPGNLIKEFTSAAQIAVNTASGIKSLTLATPFWLAPGRYYFMVQADAAVSLMFGVPVGNTGMGIHGARDVVYLAKAATYGAAPSTGDTSLTGTSRSAGGQIMIYLK